MSTNDPVVRSVQLASRPTRGWVTVVGELRDDLQYPVVELSIRTSDGKAVAATMIVDAAPEFQMTLHVGNLPVGARCLLRVEVIQADETLVVEEHPFVYAGEEP